MASIPAVLQRIRRARRETEASRALDQFRRYRPAYREILEAVEDAGGEDAQDEVSEWLIERTEQRNRFPEPETLRKHARDVLLERSVEIPERLRAE